MTPRAHLVSCLRRQAAACAGLGSPFYAALLERLAADAEAGGPAWHVLVAHAARPFDDAVALRLLGGAHRLVLEGGAPALARHYPSVAGDGDPDGAWAALRALLLRHPEKFASHLARPPQTNEVGRAAALVGAFLLLARERGLPLRLLEIGASAGLHLRFDHYRYETAGRAFGDAGSPVRFVGLWDGVPPLDAHCEVAARDGCDLEPVNPATDEGRRALLAYVWPDQAERLAALRGAIEVATRVPATVDRAPAAAWLPEKLAALERGVTTVVFHAIVWQYLSAVEQAAVRRTIEEAGTRATATVPLAWLRFEPSADRMACEIRLRSWPGDRDVLLARAGYHGRPVHWLA